jgi:hypothetical protein
MHTADRKSSLRRSLVEAVFHPSRVKRSMAMRKRKPSRRGAQVRLFHTSGGTTLRVHGSQAWKDVEESVCKSEALRFWP